MRKKYESKLFNKKVYCGECKGFPKDGIFCPVNPIKMEKEYFAPGATTLHNEMCSMKNLKNDCKDFKRK